MSEQELADLFSEQIDRMLKGENVNVDEGLEDLPDLFELGQGLADISFEASSTAQAAFQTQTTRWLTPAKGDFSMFGLSRMWLIGIVCTGIFAVITLGIVVTLSLSVFIFDGAPIAIVVPSATSEATATVVSDEDDDDGDDIMTETPEAETSTVAVTETPEGTVESDSLTPEPDATDDTTDDASVPTSTPEALIVPDDKTIVIVFEGDTFGPVRRCGDGYTAETLATISGGSLDDIDLDWDLDLASDEEFIEDIDISTDILLETADDTRVKVAVEVEMNAAWWGAVTETSIDVEVKAKLSKNRASRNSDDDITTTTLTIARTETRVVNLSGYAYFYGDDKTLLVEGDTVILDECSDVPDEFEDGSFIEIVGIDLGDGVFTAITIIVTESTTTIGLDDLIKSDDDKSSDDDSDGGGSGGGGSGGGGSSGGGGGDSGDDDDD